jgi:hypothetical protein
MVRPGESGAPGLPFFLNVARLAAGAANGFQHGMGLY